jgi:hypothetical protein
LSLNTIGDWLWGKPGVPQQLNKLSVVKCKGANPKWQPKKDQQSESKDSGNKKDSTCCGCQAGKQVKERKEKVQEKCQQNQHSHLASMTVKATPFTPAFTTIMGSGSIILPAVNKLLE